MWVSINLHLFLTQNDHMTAEDLEYSAQVETFTLLWELNIHFDNTVKEAQSFLSFGFHRGNDTQFQSL